MVMLYVYDDELSATGGSGSVSCRAPWLLDRSETEKE